MFCTNCGASVPDDAAFCVACGHAVVPSASPHANRYLTGLRPPVVYAGFWLRFLAFFIDSAVMTSLTFPLTFILTNAARLIGVSGREDPTFLIAGAILYFLIIVIGNWLYFAKMESSSWQATVGKKALGLQVTDLEGRRISFSQASARYAAKFVSSFTLGIGFLMAGFTEKKQALHDIMAGTLVVRKPQS